MKFIIPALSLLLVGSMACKKAQVVPSGVKAALEEDVAPAPPTPTRKRVLDVPMWTQTMAVMDLRISKVVPATIDEDFTMPITEKIEAAFLATGRFEIVERARIAAVKSELTDTTDSLWFDQTTVARMGKFLGAKYLALPTARLDVGVMFTRLDLQVKIIDTETASTVQTFNVRTSSSSVSTTTSITACMERIRLELGDALSPIYPAQALIVHSPRPGVFWAEAKQSKQSFKPGQKVRILEPTEVLNPVKQTTSTFLAEVGRGYVQGVEPFGVVVKAKGVKASEGYVIEAL